MCRRPTSTSLLSRCTCRDRKGLALMSWWPPRSHSNVGHHDIKAIPFGVSVSGCVTSLRHINARGWSVRWRPTRTDAMRDRSNPRRRERKDCRATFAPCEVARPASVRNPARTEAAGSSVRSAEAAIERSGPGRSRYRRRGGDGSGVDYRTGGVDSGGLRCFVACSYAYASLIRRASSHARPKIVMPAGSLSSRV
jgi:hypothetical protein